jgi:hypothetical protein
VEDQTASSFTGLFSALRKTAGVGSLCSILCL